MEYKLSAHITESCCRVSATYAEQSGKKTEDGDRRETREKGRDWGAGIGERQPGKMKQGAERRHGENSNENEKCVAGRVNRGAQRGLSERQQKWSF